MNWNEDCYVVYWDSGMKSLIMKSCVMKFITEGYVLGSRVIRGERRQSYQIEHIQILYNKNSKVVEVVVTQQGAFEMKSMAAECMQVKIFAKLLKVVLHAKMDQLPVVVDRGDKVMSYHI